MSSSIPRSVKFRNEREATWFELEDLITRIDRDGASALDPAELTRLPVLYQYTLSSLSTARAISLDQNVVRYLDSLCSRAHASVYGSRRRFRDVVSSFFAREFPRAVRTLRWYLLISTVLFFAGAASAYVMVSADPEYFYSFVGPEMASGRGPGATTEELRKALFDDGGGSTERLAVFASMLVSRNAKIGMMCFALGFAAGLPVLYLLFFNGLVIGAFFSIYASRGLSVEFFSWVLPHGITEILAVLLSGAAGLYIGKAVVAPGEHSRMDSMVLAGRHAGKVCLGAVGMFFLAALIEGFFRQMVADVEVRFLLAGSTALFWLVYLSLVGRAPK